MEEDISHRTIIFQPNIHFHVTQYFILVRISILHVTKNEILNHDFSFTTSSSNYSIRKEKVNANTCGKSKKEDDHIDVAHWWRRTGQRRTAEGPRRIPTWSWRWRRQNWRFDGGRCENVVTASARAVTATAFYATTVRRFFLSSVTYKLHTILCPPCPFSTFSVSKFLDIIELRLGKCVFIRSENSLHLQSAYHTMWFRVITKFVVRYS